MINVMVVDDHSVIQDGVELILNKSDDMQVVAKASNANEAINQLSKLVLDVVIVDLTFSNGISGIDLVKAIKERYPDIKIIVMSMHDDSIYGERAIKAGAKGYIMKDVASNYLADAIHVIMNGDLYLSNELQKKIVSRLSDGNVEKAGNPVEILSNREFEVFQLIGNGFSTKEIAKKLNISINTIESHRNNIKSKMKFKNSAELVKYAIQWIISCKK